MQLWVAQGQQPLPRRLVITYKHADGRPQFWAQLSDWNLSPEAPDSLFVFTPPKGAAKIAFSPRQTLSLAQQYRKEGNSHANEAMDAMDDLVRAGPDGHVCGHAG